MKDNDGKGSLNPNLLELGKPIWMNSSPAQVSGSLPRVSPHGLPCSCSAFGFTMVILAMQKSTHEQVIMRTSMQSSSRKPAMPDSSATDVPMVSMALQEALLGKGQTHLWEQHDLPGSSQFSFWLLTTALSWVEHMKLL